MAQRLIEGRARNSAFGDDGGDVLRWRNVECGVLYLDTLRCNRLAGKMGDFPGSSLLDRNLVAAGRLQIDGREWRRDVKRESVFLRLHGDCVGSDFVGYVAV